MLIQRGPNEFHGVKVLLLPPSCHICGHEVHPMFLKEWNGVDACKYCIKEIEKEISQHDLHNHD
jgi:uncharacterized CHY-type Zn-finger protein